MEESIKNRIILVLAILTAIFFVATLNSCNNAYRQKVARDKEMAARLDLEEKVNKFTQEKSAIEEKSKAGEKELEEEKAAHQDAKKELEQEQLVTQSLKEELQKTNKLKEALEKDLKEALVQGKAANPKK